MRICSRIKLQPGHLREAGTDGKLSGSCHAAVITAGLRSHCWCRCTHSTKHVVTESEFTSALVKFLSSCCPGSFRSSRESFRIFFLYPVAFPPPFFSFLTAGNFSYLMFGCHFWLTRFCSLGNQRGSFRQKKKKAVNLFVT